MGNVYGISQPGFVSIIETPASDITLVAGVETNFMGSGLLVAPGPGSFFPFISGVAFISLGAAAPSALRLAFNISGGSNVDIYTVNPLLLVNLANLVVPFFLVGVTSGTIWTGAGSTVFCSGFSTTQSSTVRISGTKALVQLTRGIDTSP